MLTEQAFTTLEYLNDLFLNDETFTYKEAGVSSSILVSLCKQGYLKIVGHSTPLKYSNLHKEIAENDKPKKKTTVSTFVLNHDANGKHPWTSEAKALVGTEFAGTWVVKDTYGDYKEDYIDDYEAIVGRRIRCNNAHYYVYNSLCGTLTQMEKTTIKRAIDKSCMKDCQGCNGERFGTDDCTFSKIIRPKETNKKINRIPKIFVGEDYNMFTVIATEPSGNYSDHQSRAKCKCRNCGRISESRFDTLLNGTHACECFRHRSTGEMMIWKYLEDKNISYKSEQTFQDLVGLKGGALRYDFAILKDNQIVQLIEFDGEQHKEIGYFNKDGRVFKHDDIKNIYAKENNIPLIRIPAEEINNINIILDKELIN